MTSTDKRILAYCLTDPACLTKTAATVTPAHFDKSYRKLFDSAVKYFQRYRTLITANIVAEQLRRKNAAEDRILWYQQLFRELQEIQLDPSEFEYYLEVLQSQYYDQKLRQALLGVDKDGVSLKDKKTGSIKKGAVELLTKEGNPKAAWETIKEVGLEIEQHSQTDELTQRGAVHQSVAERLAEYQRRVDNPEEAWGILTGFDPLDQVTKGLRGGELLIIGGRHGSGKSSCALVMAKNIYKGVNGQPPRNVLLISLEMPKQQYELRFDASYCNLPMDAIELGTLNEEQYDKYKQGLKEQQEKPNWLYIVDMIACSSLKIEAEIQASVQQFNPDVLIVDYLGLMQSNENEETDQREQARVVRELRALARTYKIPIISPVQLNRDRNKEREKSTQRISRSDEIGATADVVLQIDDQEDEETNALSNHITFHMIKNRKGSAPSFRMYKDFSRMQILNIDNPTTTQELVGDIDLS